MPIIVDSANKPTRRTSDRAMPARCRAAYQEILMHAQDPIMLNLRTNHRHVELLAEAERERRFAAARVEGRSPLDSIRRRVGRATIALGWWLHGHHDVDSRQREVFGSPAFGGGR